MNSPSIFTLNNILEIIKENRCQKNLSLNDLKNVWKKIFEREVELTMKEALFSNLEDGKVNSRKKFSQPNSRQERGSRMKSKRQKKSKMWNWTNFPIITEKKVKYWIDQSGARTPVFIFWLIDRMAKSPTITELHRGKEFSPKYLSLIYVLIHGSDFGWKGGKCNKILVWEPDLTVGWCAIQQAAQRLDEFRW